MAHQPGALERYWRLAVETSNYQKRLKAAGIFNYPMWVDVNHSRPTISYLAKHIPKEHQDPGLFSRWDDWATEFESIYQASPKWRLKEMISQVSETHSACSWPNRWEKEIWTWVMLADEAACPFIDRRGSFDPGFRHRLRALIEEVEGFLYRCEESGHIVFVPRADLDRIWRHQDHLAEIDRNKLFGFFYDATRPNHQMRPPTEQEEHLMTMMRRRSLAKKGWRAKVAFHLERLSRRTRD